MSGHKLYERGYKDLVSVVPPKAELAPTTTLKPGSRGKAPGLQRRDGRWVGYAWTGAGTPSPQQLDQWKRWGSNIGLGGDNYPGLDIDCENASLTKLVVQEAVKFLGPAPQRTSREPRRLLVYRTDEPFSRISAVIRYKGQEHQLEMLGTGRQYLVHGGHPSGTDYGWVGTPLWETEPDSLTSVTADKVREFFEHMQTLLDGRAEVVVAGDGALASDKAPPQEQLKAPNTEALIQLAASIPNEFPDRDDYILMGHAIKGAVGGDLIGLDIWWEWCDRWSGGKNEYETVKHDWQRMHPPYRVGWSWLQEQAAQHGYNAAQNEFEADPKAEPPADYEDEITSNGVMPFTDTWVVERLVHLLASKIRYVPETGKWHCWNGYAWEADRLNQCRYLIRRGLTQLSQEAYQRAAGCPDSKQQTKMYKFAASLQTRNALTKALPELETYPKLTITLDQFDAFHWKLNTPGGIVDLRTGTLHESHPDCLHSKATAATPAAGVPERWLKFLDETTGGDKELQRFLQKQVGYSLTGSTQEQTLSFVHGPPFTGKTVFLETIGEVFGSYHETAAADTFAAARGDRHPTDLAKLAGARLVTASETQEGRSWDLQRIKSITGGDRIAARFMHKDFFDFTPTFKIIIVGNHEPEIKGGDEATMRRIHMVPFEHTPEHVDRLLKEAMKAEWPQILQWAIDGCLLWIKDGLEPPDVVLHRTARYHAEEDPVGQFIEDCCELDPDGEVTRQELYERWRRWCHEQGEEPGPQKQLKRRFSVKERKYGLTDVRLSRSGRPRGYRGMTLTNEIDEEFS